MMKIRNILMGLAVLSCTASFAQLPDAATIAPKMYPGWNLGNTMEANNSGQNFTNNVGLGGETAWQSTKTTQEVIDFVKSQGFRSVRIPCNWVCGHISDASSVTIDAQWMARVKEIVDYCIGSGLYVLLNDHYDGGWVEKSFTDISEATITKNCATMQTIWTQIANTFRDYDEHLLFGGLNEPDCSNQAQTNALIRYEQAFIDAVRATGGNNATRTLVVQGPGTDIEKTNDWFDVTQLTDAAGSGRLMVEVHYYTPPQFTGVWENGAPIYFWGSGNHVASGAWTKYNATWGEESDVQQYFQLMKTKFADKGYPVLLGEYGANWRKFSNTYVQNKHNASIKAFNKTVCQEAVNHGMIPFLWDINVANQGTPASSSVGSDGIMTVINRANRTVFCTPAMEGITEGSAAATWGGPTSGIGTVPFDRSADVKSTQVFNVLGQRVSPTTKGLVIIGGKKYVRR